MTEQDTKTTDTSNEEPKTILGALLDLGAAWAAHCLNAGKLSLENSARALDKTAKVLENAARDFEKKKSRHSAA